MVNVEMLQRGCPRDSNDRKIAVGNFVKYDSRPLIE